MKHDEGKQERQRNGKSNNDGGANADQKENQHDQYQHHAAQQVAFDGVCSQVYEFAAVVERLDLYVMRKDVAIQFFGLRLDVLQNILRLLAAEHENDAFNRIITFLEAE